MACSGVAFCIAERGPHQIEEVDGWWKAHRRDARLLFRQELAEAIEQIENDPLFGTIYPGRIKVYRRILMPKTRYHLYYEYFPEAGVLAVAAVWSAGRGSGPNI